MWLLDVYSLRLKEFFDDAIPDYAILSHTWLPLGEEITFSNFRVLMDSQRYLSMQSLGKRGGNKIKGACVQARRRKIRYVWIDTFCINKTSSAELSEAINSMFQWYQKAKVCFAYLSDVDFSSKEPGFSQSRWFTRGWTLQELIAPPNVEFYDCHWNMIGSKEGLKELIYTITDINPDVLATGDVGAVPVGQRMSWASKRQTTRREDRAYCLLGIFGVAMSLQYGEGDKAFLRLQSKILKTTDDSSIFAWRSGCVFNPGTLEDFRRLNSWNQARNQLLAPSQDDFGSCAKLFGPRRNCDEDVIRIPKSQYDKADAYLAVARPLTGLISHATDLTTEAQSGALSETRRRQQLPTLTLKICAMAHELSMEANGAHQRNTVDFIQSNASQLASDILEEAASRYQESQIAADKAIEQPEEIPATTYTVENCPEDKTVCFAHPRVFVASSLAYPRIVRELNSLLHPTLRFEALALVENFLENKDRRHVRAGLLSQLLFLEFNARTGLEDIAIGLGDITIQEPLSWLEWIRDEKPKQRVERGMARIVWNRVSFYVDVYDIRLATILLSPINGICLTIQKGVHTTSGEIDLPEKIAKGFVALETKYPKRAAKTPDYVVPRNSEQPRFIFLMFLLWSTSDLVRIKQLQSNGMTDVDFTNALLDAQSRPFGLWWPWIYPYEVVTCTSAIVSFPITATSWKLRSLGYKRRCCLSVCTEFAALGY